MIHIFPKAQVTWNKKVHNFWHHFQAQFFVLLHLAWSILFGVLEASFKRFLKETAFLLVEIPQ